MVVQCLKSSVFLLLFSLGMACFVVVDAGAAQYVVTPSVELQETYDDNVFLKEIDDFEHLISPGLVFDVRTERTELKAGGAWDISDYQRHSELDSVDQTYEFSASVNPSELWRLDFSGQYKDDYTFISALEESGIIADRSRRKRATLEPGVAIVLDPRNTLEFSYDFVKTQYDLERYPDYRVHGPNLTWIHGLMNERTSIICSAGATLVDFEETSGDLNVRQRTYRGLAGIDHRFSETLQLRLLAGASYTESKFPRAGLSVEEKDTGLIVDGALEWRLERLSLSGNVNRDITPSIYGENVTRDRVRAGLRYRFTEKLRSGLSVSYYHTETDGLVDREKRLTYSVRPSMIYRFTEDVDLRLGYAYTWTENEITDYSQERNRFFLELAVAWPKTFD
ncbi:MAG: outer membrane beta-barrel protein [Deltaproteobacteria bacterium]|nr:outer membrane beta-barrel protein [Deltaproteobacteria bacterium]